MRNRLHPTNASTEPTFTMNSTRTNPTRFLFASILRTALALCVTTGAFSAAGCHSDTLSLKGDQNANLRTAIEHASKGDRLRKSGKFAPAAEEYKKSFAAKSDIGAVWINYGACLVELGDFIPARDAFLRAADLMPADPTPYENMGTLWHLRKYDKLALEYFVLSLEKEPNWLPSLRGAIRSAMNLRLADENSLNRLDRAILLEKDPKYLSMMHNERFRIEAVLKDHSK